MGLLRRRFVGLSTPTAALSVAVPGHVAPMPTEATPYCAPISAPRAKNRLVVEAAYALASRT